MDQLKIKILLNLTFVLLKLCDKNQNLFIRGVYTESEIQKLNRIKNMLLKFTLRFVAVLFSVLIITALSIHFFFSEKIVTDLWIIVVPVILGIPMLTAITLTKDEELNLS
jgi:hypothetical protein